MSRLAALIGFAAGMLPNFQTYRPTQMDPPKPVRKTRADFERLAAAQAKRQRKAAKRAQGE